MANEVTKGLIMEGSYVNKSDVEKMREVIKTYLVDKDIVPDTTDNVAMHKYLRKEQIEVNGEVKWVQQSRAYYKDVIDEINAGIWDIVIWVLNSDFETDNRRFGSIPSDKLEDKTAPKSTKQILEEELRRFCELSILPPKLDDIDSTLHWFLGNTRRDVVVIHVDMSTGNPQPYNVSEEYYAEIHHDTVLDEDGEVDEEKSLNELEQAWATAIAYEGFARDNIKWLLENMSEDEMYEWANGGMIPGTSPDRQIVKCPECGFPTWASAASVGFKNYTGEYVPTNVDAGQMKCEHCGADLSPCFSKKDNRRDDYGDVDVNALRAKHENANDLFDSLANQPTTRAEVVKSIQPERIVVKGFIKEVLQDTFDLAKEKYDDIFGIEAPKKIVSKYTNPGLKKNFEPYAEPAKFPDEPIKCTLLRTDSNKIVDAIKEQTSIDSEHEPMWIYSAKNADFEKLVRGLGINKHVVPPTGDLSANHITIKDSEVPEDFPVTIIK